MTSHLRMELSIALADGTEELLVPDAAGAVVVGRDPACHVVLPSPEVSRRHVTLQVVGGNLVVTDTSANGTFLGNEHVHNTALAVPLQTPVRVGPYLLTVRRTIPLDSQGHRGAPIYQGASAPKAETVPAPAGVTAAYRAVSVEPLLRPEPTGHVQAAPGVRPGPSGFSAPNIRLPESKPSTDPSDPYAASGTRNVSVSTRKRIHRMLLDNLDLASLDRNKMGDDSMRPKVRTALRRIVTELGAELGPEVDVGALIDEITDEALGLGPLERLLADPAVTEIMVVDPTTIFVERKGKLTLSSLRFTDDEAVRAVIERIVTPLGRRIDESTPLVDARLKDGSRVNAVIRPLAIRGSCITIRKFSKTPLTIENLIGFGAMTQQMAKFLQRTVQARKNIVISGGTGSGKTTLLNVLSAAIPEDERVVTIEDAAELQLNQVHVVSLETRPANMEGKGEYTIRDLVKNALRMRPDRIIVGECRGGEALDMLQAMNTGHDGSMTTTHANNPREAISRIETLALMSGLDLPQRAIREQIATAVHVIVQQSRFSDGSRRVSAISEVVGIDENGDLELHDIFKFVRTGTEDNGKIIGEFRASGYLPSFVDELIAKGLVTDGDFV